MFAASTNSTLIAASAFVTEGNLAEAAA